MALTDYDREHLNSAQQAAVEQATRDWNAANARGDTEGMERAHAAAEAARNSGGYSSDSWGYYSSSYPPSYSEPTATYYAGDYGHDVSDAVSGLVRNPDTGYVYSPTGRNMTGQKMIDWANDKTDYAASAKQATSISEINSLLDKRSQKAAAQGIDISGSNPSYQSNDDIYNEWWDSRGKYIPESFNYGGSQKGTGFYGEDENGDFGYYADPERTIKLENGGWDKSFRKDSTQVRSGGGVGSSSGSGGGVSGVYGGGYGSYGNYGGRPVYNDAYADEIANMTRRLLNRDPFSYDLDKDPLYGYYSTMFERNGQRAMKDTLGQIAARTGGMASSWAGSQAQQSYNDYMAGLNDIVPELYKLAYNMYQDDEDYQRKNIDLLQSLEEGDYKKYLNQLNQWNTDRDFDYGAYRDSVADQKWYDQTAYERMRDAVSDERYNDTTGYERLMDAARLGAQYGDYSGLSRLGITPNLETEATSGGSSGGSGRRSSGGGGSTSSANGSDTDKWRDVEDYVALGGDAEDFIKANYKNLGYSAQSAALSAWNVYQTQNKAAGVEAYPTSVTRDNLANLDYNDDEGVFTWNGRKYRSMEALESALNSAIESGAITPAIEDELKRRLYAYGFNV